MRQELPEAHRPPGPANGRWSRRAPAVRRGVAVATVAAGALLPAGSEGFAVAVATALLLALGEIGHDASRLLLPRCAPLSRAVAVFTLALAFATTLATGLGHFGLLRREPFLLATAAVALLGPLVRRWRPAPAASGLEAAPEPQAGSPSAVAQAPLPAGDGPWWLRVASFN